MRYYNHILKTFETKGRVVLQLILETSGKITLTSVSMDSLLNQSESVNLNAFVTDRPAYGPKFYKL